LGVHPAGIVGPFFRFRRIIMAFELVAEHEWHGNPRPVKSYSYTFSDPTVTNPVTGYKHLVTVNSRTPIEDLAPAAGTIVAGPDTVVTAGVTGLWNLDKGLNVAITVEGGTDISTTIVNGTGQVLGQDAFAALVASALNTIGGGEIDCQTDLNLIDIAAVDPVTALTITIWAVAP
jgi:hypothetical protein